MDLLNNAVKLHRERRGRRGTTSDADVQLTVTTPEKHAVDFAVRLDRFAKRIPEPRRDGVLGLAAMVRLSWS